MHFHLYSSYPSVSSDPLIKLVTCVLCMNFINKFLQIVFDNTVLKMPGALKVKII